MTLCGPGGGGGASDRGARSVCVCTGEDATADHTGTAVRGKELTQNMPYMFVTLEVSQPEMSALKWCNPPKSPLISVTRETHQPAMAPYFAMAAAAFESYSVAAVLREALSVKVLLPVQPAGGEGGALGGAGAGEGGDGGLGGGGDGLGGGGDGLGGEGLGGGGEGLGGGGEGEGGGGEGDTHPLHWRTSWTSALNSALNSARRSAIAAARSRGVMKGGDAAPTLPITQEAANSLSRSVNLVLGRRRGDLVCPGEWS